MPQRPSTARETRRPISGRVDRCFLSPLGTCLILGWLADEGCDPVGFALRCGDADLSIPATAILRHARPDVEQAIRPGAYDYGFICLIRMGDPAMLDGELVFEARGRATCFAATVQVEFSADKRVLDTVLEMLPSLEAHAGSQVVLNVFLGGVGGDVAGAAFRTHVAASLKGLHVERFRPRPVAQSFITVLFGSAEPILLQPVLFRQAGVEVGEWIYVCNSPEDAGEALRVGRMISDLYDLPITVITFGDNVGFGAANNTAIEQAAGASIVLINPDVHVMQPHAAALSGALRAGFGSTLWGGLLFYQDDVLMHGGMFMEADTFTRKNVLNAGGDAAVCRLLRVEHFDKGVPFDPEAWTQARPVPAVSGAVMAFSRPCFEALGGFSTDYIYGHYEDADLCLRWRAEGGDVAVHSQLRLVHLEGQGSKSSAAAYRGAAIANRHLFSRRHGSHAPQVV